jgi:restriction system protein
MQPIDYYDTDESMILGEPAWIPNHYDGIQYVEKCPLCSCEIEKINLNDVIEMNEFVTFFEKQEQSVYLYAFSCNRCHWFTVVREVTDYDYKDHGHARFTRSIIKQFDLESAKAPVDVLCNYLVKKNRDIHRIHYRKMEELVGSVFKEYFNCEIIHCGRAGDGGIDLFLVQSDTLIPIQVKRRIHANATEPVDTVTKMLGVMIRDGFKKSMIVTTADKYSKPATSDVQKVLTKGIFESINLFNRNDFLAILKQQYHGKEKTYIDVQNQ